MTTMPRPGLPAHLAGILRVSLVAALLVLPAMAGAQQPPTPTHGPRGDVNLDGTVTAADAQAILYAVVGLALPSSYAPMPWGDVNGDGRVTALDAQIVLSYVVGLPTTRFSVGADMSRVTSVAVTPGTEALLAGGTAQLSATVADSTGTALSDRPVSYASSDTTVVTVSATGVVTARRDGYASVTVTSEGIVRTVYVGVGAITANACGIAGASGTPHGGAVTTSQTWTRAASPHYVGADLLVDAGAVLTVEPGAAVCVAPNTMLSFNTGARLSALGSAQLPITFSASDTAQYWRGFVFDGAPSDFSYLHGVMIAYAGARQTTARTGAVVARGTHRVSLDSARIRHSDARALDLGAAGSLVQRTIIDTTRVQADLASFATVATRTVTTLDSVIVRGSAGFGVATFGPGLTLRDLTIDGGAQTGLSVDAGALVAGTRITVRNTRLPFQGGVDALAMIAPTPAEQALLLGNVGDTAIVSGGVLRRRTLSLTRALPLAVAQGFNVDSGGVLMMRSGARMAFGDTIGITVNPGGRLDARGTVTDSVVFTASDTTKNWGPILFENPNYADTNFVRYAKVAFGGVRLAVNNARGNLDPAFEADQGTTIIDSSSFRKWSGLALVMDDRSILRAVALDSGLANGLGAVYAGGNSTIEDVSVTRASDAGFYIAPRTGSIITLKGLLTVDGQSEPLRGAFTVTSTGSPPPTSIANFATVTVRNARGYPISLGAQFLSTFVPDSVAQARYIGNGNLKDTMLVIASIVKRDTIRAFGHLAWRVSGALTVDSGAVLALRPGARVAVDSNLVISFNRGGRLLARGTSSAPIRVGSARTTATGIWGGFVFNDTPGDSSYITNALIDGGRAFATLNTTGRFSGTNAAGASHPLIIDSVRIRQSRYRAVNLGSSSSRLSRSVIDTTQFAVDSAGSPASAVQTSGVNVTVEGTTVRGSAGGGAVLAGSAGRWLNGAIVGSNGTGLFVNSINRSALAAFSPPQITGGASYPIGAASALLTVIAHDSAMIANYTGNGKDTIDVYGFTTYRDTIPFNAGLPYRIRNTVTADTNALLLIRPGARLAINGSISLVNGARIFARGEASRRILMTSLVATGSWGGVNAAGTPSGDSSYITNALLERAGSAGMAIAGGPSHPLILDSIRVRQSPQNGINLLAAGSRLSRSVVDTTNGTPLTSYAVRAAGYVTLDADTIRGSSGFGIYGFGAANRITGGAIIGSRGIGLALAQPYRDALAQFVAPSIVGGATYPLQVTANNLIVVAHDSAMMANYAGNARDTIDVTYGVAYRDTIPFNPGLAYRTRGFTADTNSLILIRPGARLAIADSQFINATNGARLDARGTAAAAIRLTSLNPVGHWYDISLQGTPADSSYVSWALIERGGGNYATFGNASTHPVIITNTRIRQSGLRALNLGTASRVQSSIIDTTGAGVPALTFYGASSTLSNSIVRGAEGTGVLLNGSGHAVTSTEISGAGDDLLSIGGGAVTHALTSLNLVGYGLKGTGGVAVRNSDPLGATTLTGTWWGSAAGKPAGSTVGNVVTTSDNTNSANPVTPSTP
jgi:hypothetical protein